VNQGRTETISAQIFVGQVEKRWRGPGTAAYAEKEWELVCLIEIVQRSLNTSRLDYLLAFLKLHDRRTRARG
jgi:hypothetical protein